jgi:ABC-type multidrug transport system fused ATPase/permease subunit
MKALVNLGLLFIVLFLAGWEFFLVTIVTCIVVLVGRYFFKKLYWDKPHRAAERERKYQEELQRIYDEWERECNESSKRCLERLRKYSDHDS